MSNGFYVDANGCVCCADIAPDGFHFEFHDQASYRQVWIIRDEDGEVFEEYVLWPSLEALSEAGVDTSSATDIQQ